MKLHLIIVAIVLSFAVPVFSQPASPRFPGISVAQHKALAAAKRSLAFPLPTWVPDGFLVEDIRLKVGPRVKTEDKEFIVVYSRRLASGKIQRFSIEAGFDGLGDLPYEDRTRVRTPVGSIWLVYDPRDDDGQRTNDFAMTEWFKVGRHNFHYDGMYGHREGDTSLAMITRDETVRILRSLQRY
jgi:hypothetical protein